MFEIILIPSLVLALIALAIWLFCTYKVLGVVTFTKAVPLTSLEIKYIEQVQAKLALGSYLEREASEIIRILLEDLKREKKDS